MKPEPMPWRARPHAGLAGKARHRHAEAAQEVVEGVVGEGVLARRALRGALHHADVDHGRAHLLDQVAEVGQAEAVGRDHRRGGRLGVRGGKHRGLGEDRAERERDGGDGQKFAHVVGHPCSATEIFGAGVPAATCRGRGRARAVPGETCVFTSGRARALQEGTLRKSSPAPSTPGGSPGWRAVRRTRPAPAGGGWRAPGGGRAG